VIRVGILTISGSGARGEREDATVTALREILLYGDFEVAAVDTVPDEAAQIKRVVRLWADRDGLDLILTSGGIGLSTRDNAPEATREMLEKEAPGIVEFVRLMTFKKDPSIALTRGVAGARGKTLIVNLPAAQAAVTALEVALPLIPEALQSILGQAPVETVPLRRA